MMHDFCTYYQTNTRAKNRSPSLGPSAFFDMSIIFLAVILQCVVCIFLSQYKSRLTL